MKRIVIFSLTYHPFVGGAEVAIKEITDRLSPEEYAFEMITLRFDRNLPKREKIGNVTVHRIGFSVRGAKVSDRSMPLSCKVAKTLFPLTSFFKALSLRSREKFDLAWVMMANQGAFGALLYCWLYPDTPMVLELQDGRAFEDMKKRRPILRVLWPLYKRIYLRADIITCISRYIAKEVRGIGYKGKVEVIPNGVDIQKFTQPIDKKSADSLAKKLGKGPNDVFLFTASRLVLSRGVEDILQALAGLPRHVKLLVAGDGEDREKLEAIARGFAVGSRVTFLGQVSHDELPAYYHISDIFVRPSIIEGMGNAFIEAFAAGVPIIGTPVGGIPDFLRDGETGLFCEVRDPGSIMQAVERYLHDGALRARIVERAQKLAAEKYDWTFIARDMREKIFKAV